MRRCSQQGIVHPLDVITRIRLEIRVPGDLLGIHDLAIDERRGLAIAAAQVEADAASLEMPAHRHSGLDRRRQRFEGRRLDRKPAAKDFRAHERVIEGPRARRAVDFRKRGSNVVGTGHEHLWTALHPEEKFQQSLRIDQRECRRRMACRQDAAIMAKHRAIRSHEHEREGAGAGILRHERRVGATPQRGGHKLRIERWSHFGVDRQRRITAGRSGI